MRQRVITALLLAVPCLLALALQTPWPLAALGLVACMLGGAEADRLLKLRFPAIAIASALLFGLGAAPLLADGRPEYGLFSLLLANLTLFGIAAAVPHRSPYHGLINVFACFWVACPLAAILVLHRYAEGSPWVLSPALMALVPVWAGDIAAIFAGRAFGKRPLAPKISPKKTIEGGIANLLAAVLVAWLLGRLLHIEDVRALGAGLAVGILGQAGDLFESWLKRRVDAKDSGTLLPGHGGVLDRIDSVLFAAPAVAVILLSGR